MRNEGIGTTGKSGQPKVAQVAKAVHGADNSLLP